MSAVEATDLMEAFLSPADMIRMAIEALPVLHKETLGPLDEAESCPICLVPLSSIFKEQASKQEDDRKGLGVTKLDGCGHIFCKKDLAEWIRGRHGSCPTCRHTFLNISSESDDESSDGGEYIPNSDEIEEDEEDWLSHGDALDVDDFDVDEMDFDVGGEIEIHETTEWDDGPGSLMEIDDWDDNLNEEDILNQAEAVGLYDMSRRYNGPSEIRPLTPGEWSTAGLCDVEISQSDWDDAPCSGDIDDADADDTGMDGTSWGLTDGESGSEESGNSSDGEELQLHAHARPAIFVREQEQQFKVDNFDAGAK